MTVAELIADLEKMPADAEVYVDVHQVDCFGLEMVDSEEDDGEVTVYLVIGVE
jgi:hypothetical protein